MTRRLAVTVLFLTMTVVPATAMAVASAELFGTQPYLYGRFEARMRLAPGDGVVSAFFLWKEGSADPGVFWNELDFEKVNADCHMTTNARYGNPGSNLEHSLSPTIAADLCGAYHTYAFEWTPTSLAWIVDGQVVRRDTGANPAAYVQNATAGMTFHFNIWAGNINFGGVLNQAILPVRQYVSWVQYSSFEPTSGAFQLQWREEFQDGTLPAGWLLGDFASPFNLSVHSPLNVNFVNGIAVMSMTADNATGFTGTPPVDPAAGGGAGGTGAGGAGGGGRGGSGAGGGAGAGTGGAGTGGTATGGTGAGGAGTGGGGGASTGGAGRGGAGTGGGIGGTGGAGTGGAGTGGAGTGGLAGGATGGMAVGGAAGMTTPTGSTGGSGTGGRPMTTSTGGAGTGQPAANGGCSCQIDRGMGGSFGPALFALLLVLTRRRGPRGARRNR